MFILSRSSRWQPRIAASRRPSAQDQFRDLHTADHYSPERELTVEIIAGDNSGFSDTVEYEAVAVRDGLVILSWQEHIGSTIVHVLDLTSCNAYTAVKPAEGGFLRLTGRIEVKSET
jgi:hypothetical protein